jgi:hypothetical protein
MWPMSQEWFLFLSMVEKSSKEDFVTWKNHIKFKCQCP